VPDPVGDPHGLGDLRVNLLGPFSITLGENSAGPWARPSARRLCQLVLVSAGRRISREAACEVLFPNLAPPAAANALSRALSMAKTALSALGNGADGVLRTDRGHIWLGPDFPVEVDVEVREDMLQAGLDMAPGAARDDRLVAALAEYGALLEDEPDADWAARHRERLERLHEEARLALARDRSRGFGRSRPEAVVQAWEACLSDDPGCEEAASALMRVYGAQGRHALVDATYNRCRSALEELGLRISPALEEVRGAINSGINFPRPAEGPPPASPSPYKEERRLVSVLFAELAGPVGTGHKLSPEDQRERVGGALAGVVAHVEALGGTVTSLSGAGLVALFGAPESHEDDPERALRAAFRAVTGAGTGTHGLAVRTGVETGPVVVGPIGGATTAHYGALGEVVSVAAALQSVAKPGSVLVGQATRAATEGLFEWGPSEEVLDSAGAKPLVGYYLERPKPRPLGQAGRRGLAGSTPLVGRQAELAVLHDVLRQATTGKGGVVLVAGEPGLGKTRLVSECRKLFMAWVGAASGRLPLWLEARAASYGSSSPYGLYQRLLAAWVGVTPEEGQKVAHVALERAIKAIFNGKAVDDEVGLLSQLMGLGPGKAAPVLTHLSPEQRQRSTFEAVRALVSRLAAHGPTVLVLEDLHWADPTSLHLTEELACVAKQGPLLLVLTRRPEPDPGVSALEAALGADPDLVLRRLQLSPLAQNVERDLARYLLGEGAPDEVVLAVTEGTEGNPFFLEERFFSLVDTGALVRAEAGWQFDSGAPGELPEALERLIRSRVDRLGPLARETIVAASVLGAEFSLSALGGLGVRHAELPQTLAELCAAGLISELRQLPEPAFSFRHALIQDATYKGLLRQQRRQLHAKAAWALEEASADRLEEVAGLLGHHYVAAGENERAVHFLRVAGDHAASVFANEEAVSSYRSALAIVGKAHPAGELKDEAAVQLRSKLIEVLWHTGRHGEAREVIREAIGLVDAHDSFRAARLYYFLGRIELADRCLEPAEAAFGAAEELLGSCPEDQAALDLWFVFRSKAWRRCPTGGTNLTR
jgi:class 3 adenylate cyclase/tetratricopeptide (TPR) repeat protein